MSIVFSIYRFFLTNDIMNSMLTFILLNLFRNPFALCLLLLSSLALLLVYLLSLRSFRSLIRVSILKPPKAPQYMEKETPKGAKLGVAISQLHIITVIIYISYYDALYQT